MNMKFRNNCAKILGAVFLFLGLFNNANVPKAETVPEKIGEEFMLNSLEGQTIDCFLEGAGIKNLTGTYILDSKYYDPGKFVIYYGELSHSGISDYSVYDFMVVHDRNYESVQTVKEQGCSIYQYLSFGSKFEDTDTFINEFKNEISELKSQGLADGIFIDECDVAYWGEDYPNQPDKCKVFHDRLKVITDYCKSIELRTVVNGSRAFCELGDYYLWESFKGYWSTNSLVWGNTPSERTEAPDGALTYKMPLSKWKTGGSCHFDGNSIRDGENGYVEMTVDMDSIVELKDRKQVYDWVYLQWFGKNTANVNCNIYAWVGDSMPFDEKTWDKLPVLWESKVKTWNGIGKTSKYIKIRMEFKDSKDLQINSIQLTYNYLYPYWNMNDSDAERDKNLYLWNYNNAQRDYLWEKTKETGNKVKILAHTYGSEDDEYKKMYSYLSARIWGCYSFDYVHPRMQNIYDANEIDNPLGMLLKREGNDKGYFTGATAEIDTSLHQYSLTRNEPDYWYKRAVNVDGKTNEWVSEDILYENYEKVISVLPQYWSASPNTFMEGTFDNIEMVRKPSGETVLELINEGVGIWTSPVISAEKNESNSMRAQFSQGEMGEGNVNYYIKYKSESGEWSDWLDVSDENAAAYNGFVQFQVKVVLSGSTSYDEIFVQKDTEGNILSENNVFHQGSTFIGSTHRWSSYLSDDINVKKLSVTDDCKYIYFSFEVNGSLDFEKGTDYLYEIYMNTSGNDGAGYTGNWWTASFGADYKICNNSIYKWNGNYSKNDYKGWSCIGESNVVCKISDDKKSIEYRIRKDTLGGLDSKTVKIYMYTEDTKTKTGNFIQPIECGNTKLKEGFSYSQKYYKLNTPHGWFSSKEVDVSDETDVGITWEQSTPAGTSVKAWIRTKQKNLDWSYWQEVQKGEIVLGNYEKAQYCFGLYTNDGEVTPIVKNINYIFGN